jgi:hypothetical protein
MDSGWFGKGALALVNCLSRKTSGILVVDAECGWGTMKMKRYSSFDDYLDHKPPKKRSIIRALRRFVKREPGSRSR